MYGGGQNLRQLNLFRIREKRRIINPYVIHLTECITQPRWHGTGSIDYNKYAVTLQL